MSCLSDTFAARLGACRFRSTRRRSWNDLGTPLTVLGALSAEAPVTVQVAGLLQRYFVAGISSGAGK